MARDPRKHQKRMEAKRKKTKERRKQQHQLATASPFQLLAKAESAPFLPCNINTVAFTEGMGNLIVPRALPRGHVAYVSFLIDLYCLGIKDITYDVCSRSALSMIEDKVYRDGSRELTPEEAKKLVVEAAAYAKTLGFPPHEDYAKALAIFDGVDASTCTTQFAFGRDGKPCYINGPNDNGSFQRRVVETLERTVGPGNYDYVVLTPGDDWYDDEDDEP